MYKHLAVSQVDGFSFSIDALNAFSKHLSVSNMLVMKNPFICGDALQHFLFPLITPPVWEKLFKLDDSVAYLKALGFSGSFDGADILSTVESIRHSPCNNMADFFSAFCKKFSNDCDFRLTPQISFYLFHQYWRYQVAKFQEHQGLTDGFLREILGCAQDIISLIPKERLTRNDAMARLKDVADLEEGSSHINYIAELNKAFRSSDLRQVEPKLFSSQLLPYVESRSLSCKDVLILCGIYQYILKTGKFPSLEKSLAFLDSPPDRLILDFSGKLQMLQSQHVFLWDNVLLKFLLGPIAKLPEVSLVQTLSCRPGVSHLTYVHHGRLFPFFDSSFPTQSEFYWRVLTDYFDCDSALHSLKTFLEVYFENIVRYIQSTPESSQFDSAMKEKTSFSFMEWAAPFINEVLDDRLNFDSVSELLTPILCLSEFSSGGEYAVLADVDTLKKLYITVRFLELFNLNNNVFSDVLYQLYTPLFDGAPLGDSSPVLGDDGRSRVKTQFAQFYATKKIGKSAFIGPGVSLKDLDQWLNALAKSPESFESVRLSVVDALGVSGSEKVASTSFLSLGQTIWDDFKKCWDFFLTQIDSIGRVYSQNVRKKCEALVLPEGSEGLVSTLSSFFTQAKFSSLYLPTDSFALTALEELFSSLQEADYSKAKTLDECIEGLCKALPSGSLSLSDKPSFNRYFETLFGTHYSSSTRFLIDQAPVLVEVIQQLKSFLSKISPSEYPLRPYISFCQIVDSEKSGVVMFYFLVENPNKVSRIVDGYLKRISDSVGVPVLVPSGNRDYFADTASPKSEFYFSYPVTNGQTKKREILDVVVTCRPTTLKYFGFIEPHLLRMSNEGMQSIVTSNVRTYLRQEHSWLAFVCDPTTQIPVAYTIVNAHLKKISSLKLEEYDEDIVSKDGIVTSSSASRYLDGGAVRNVFLISVSASVVDPGYRSNDLTMLLSNLLVGRVIYEYPSLLSELDLNDEDIPILFTTRTGTPEIVRLVEQRFGKFEYYPGVNRVFSYSDEARRLYLETSLAEWLVSAKNNKGFKPATNTVLNAYGEFRNVELGYSPEAEFLKQRGASKGNALIFLSKAPDFLKLLFCSYYNLAEVMALSCQCERLKEEAQTSQSSIFIHSFGVLMSNVTTKYEEIMGTFVGSLMRGGSTALSGEVHQYIKPWKNFVTALSSCYAGVKLAAHYLRSEREDVAASSCESLSKATYGSDSSLAVAGFQAFFKSVVDAFQAKLCTLSAIPFTTSSEAESATEEPLFLIISPFLDIKWERYVKMLQDLYTAYPEISFINRGDNLYESLSRLSLLSCIHQAFNVSIHTSPTIKPELASVGEVESVDATATSVPATASSDVSSKRAQLEALISNRQEIMTLSFEYLRDSMDTSDGEVGFISKLNFLKELPYWVILARTATDADVEVCLKWLSFPLDLARYSSEDAGALSLIKTRYSVDFTLGRVEPNGHGRHRSSSSVSGSSSGSRV